MSAVSERELSLILDLLLSRISEDEFHRQFPIVPGAASAAGLAMLQRAVQTPDPVGVEFGLYLGHRFGISPEYLDVLIALAGASWHERHEDVVDGLAKLKAPTSVDALYGLALAKYTYREYDDACSLGVKSIRALGAIQSVEAVERLAALLRCGNDILVSQAERQLLRMECSGASETVRDAARRILASHRSV
jgi:hypothetical protein